jgi:thiosulfate/3-mercaptopyruvate sulfurtransferase
MEDKKHWTKKELVAYILLYAAQSDFVESNKEKNVIISKVDMKTFQRIHDEFDKDNDYQSIQKIIAGLKEHQYSKMDIDLLFADIKGLFFADGNYDTTEQSMYMFLKRILN